MSDTWADFKPQAVAAPNDPWAAFVPAPEPGYAEDIVKSAPGAVVRGVTGVAGGGGTVGGLIRAGLSKAGVSDETLDKGAALVRGMGIINPVAKLLTGPDAGQLQKAVEGYTGPFYQAKTVPGQYTSTALEMAPGAALGGGSLGARVLNTLTGAFGSETAGQLTKGTAAEPYARFVGGLAAPAATAKAITPFAAPSAARQAAVNVLESEGIPVSAGQRTGNKSLQWLESNAADLPGAARPAQEMAARQAAAYDRAMTEHMYDPRQLTARGVPEGVNLPDPRVVRAGKQSLEDEYTRLSRNPLRSDPRLHTELYAPQLEYQRKVLPSQRAGGARDLETIRNDITDALLAGRGQIAGDQYQAIRSQLGTQANAAFTGQNPQLGRALKGMRTAMDDAMARGLSPADAMAWRLNNQRWANMRQTEGAVASANAGENLSPLRVAQTARMRRPGQYAAQQGDLDALAQAGATIMKPLPNSGTAARLQWQKLFNLPAMMATGGLGGTAVGGPAGGVAGALLGGATAVTPAAIARAALSRPGQAYLGNQWLPQNMRDVIAQAMAQQAISQRSGE